MNPLQGKSSAGTSTVPLSIKQEEPTSTVEMVANSSSSTDCVSPDLGEMSGPNSAPSVTVSASPDSIPSVNVNDNPDSIPSATVSANPGSKESPQPHSMKSMESGSRSNSFSSAILSSSSPPNTNQVLSSQITTTLNPKSNPKYHSSCLPDSTTQSQPTSHKNTDAKLNHTASSSDQGYHSISSSRGGQMTASIGNESELSGASSCVHRSSPESSQYRPYSPEYPQSVFSSDGSLPPPSNHALSHVDSNSSESNHSQPSGTTVLHHPNGQLSHVMTPVMTQPVKQVTPTHQMQASDVYPQHFIHSQPIHGDNFGVHSQVSHQQLGHQVQTDGRRTVIVGNGYGALQFPQQNYSTVMNGGRNVGANPANYVFPHANANQMGMTFVKTEPASPPYYTPPYMSGNPVPQPRGAAAIFTGPHYLEGQGFHQQSVGAQMFTASATAPGNRNNVCLQVTYSDYHIVGNFRMVQNFAVFADRSAAVKIRTVNFSSASFGLLVDVVSPER